MANVIINDTNLTNIANAIREKNGTTNSYKPSEMANAIAAIEASGGGGYEPTDEELTLNFYNPSSTDGYGSIFENGNCAWMLREYGDKISIKTGPYLQNIFSYYPYEVFDANITLTSDTQYFAIANMFNGSGNLKEITGSINITRSGSTPFIDALQAFINCHKLRVINDNFVDASKLYWNKLGSKNNFGAFFSQCYSLREIPKFFYGLFKDKNGNNIMAYYGAYWYYRMFYNCYTLNKIEDLPVIVATDSDDVLSSNKFSGAFDNCHNLHKLTFQTNPDGTPIVAKWKNQTIDLTKSVGHASYNSNMTVYNSGYTSADEVKGPTVSTDPSFLQFFAGEGLINKFTADSLISKYGHLEAVETINSLPDTSAAGGGNTIKFSGQGYWTDYVKGRTTDKDGHNSSISKLTEEEIAVATAKGWTVTFG
jgi:hypothetical protein